MSRIKLYLFCIFSEQKNGRHEIKDVQTGYIFMLTTPVLNIYDLLNFVQCYLLNLWLLTYKF